MYVIIILQISFNYRLEVFQCVFLVFRLVQYERRCFRICLNVFLYVQMLLEVMRFRRFFG